MDETYFLREQTAAKHFILRHYLQGLALITLQGSFPTLTYVDGFSGPWKSRKHDFSDTSFMIAIKLLRDIQWQLRTKGLKPVVKCFFVEKDTRASGDRLSLCSPRPMTGSSTRSRASGRSRAGAGPRRKR